MFFATFFHLDSVIGFLSASHPQISQLHQQLRHISMNKHTFEAMLALRTATKICAPSFNSTYIFNVSILSAFLYVIMNEEQNTFFLSR